MIANIISTLLATVTTLLLGFFAGWHHDFDAKQAAVLNCMVMLYALPLSLFAGMVGIGRDQVRHRLDRARLWLRCRAP
jgi:malonate transporter and related proteins